MVKIRTIFTKIYHPPFGVSIIYVVLQQFSVNRINQPEQMDLLKKYGCGVVQGPWIALAPMDLNALLNF